MTNTSDTGPHWERRTAHISICPRCQEERGGERFCWFCSEDFEKHDGLCTECGQPKDLMTNIERYVRSERLA